MKRFHQNPTAWQQFNQFLKRRRATATADERSRKATVEILEARIAPASLATLALGSISVLGDQGGGGQVETLVFSVSLGELHITDATHPITAGTGFTQNGPNDVSIALTSLTANFTVNTGTGADLLTLSSALSLPGNFNLASGGGITFNQAVTLAAGNSLTATASGTISLPNAASNLETSGTGAISLTTARDIALASGASITTENGVLTLSANQQLTPTSGNFAGVNVVGTVSVSGAGSLTVLGKGGDDPAGGQHGILVSAGGSIQGGTTAVATVTGTAGPSSGNSSIGVVVQGNAGIFPSSITTNGGNLSVAGVGGGTGASSGNHAVAVLSPAAISASGTGSVTISGTGGAGAGGGHAGVIIGAGAYVETSGGGNVQITGVAGSGGSGNTGFEIAGPSAYLSAGAGGNITLVADTMSLGGSVSGTGALNIRPVNAAATIGLGTGATGTLNLDNSQLANLADGFSSITFGGNIASTLTEGFSGTGVPVGLSVDGAFAAFDGSNVAFNGNDPGRTYLQTLTDNFASSFTAEITVILDNDSVAFFGMGDGTRNPLWFNEPTPAVVGTQMVGSSILSGRVITSDVADGQNDNGTQGFVANVGTGTHRVRLNWNATAQTMVVQYDTNYAGGPFVADISSAPVNGADNGFAGSPSRIYFGGQNGVRFDDLSAPSVARPNINIVGATFTDAVNFIGNNVDVSTLNAGLNNVSVNGTAVNPSGSGVDVTAGTLAFAAGSNLSIAINGATVDTQYRQLNAVGAVNLTGLNLALSGGFSGDSFIIVNNDGADAVIGTFSGLPEGSLVNVNGALKRLTYIGGTGNDVALIPNGTTEFSLSGGSLVITDVGGGTTNDTLTITRNGANFVRITDPLNLLAAGVGMTQVNGNTVDVPLASITAGITINTLGGDDVVTLDFTGGNAFATGGITYNGGAGGNDSLVLTGGTAGTVTHSFTNANDGSVTLAGAIGGTLNYTGLDPITDNLSATDRVFTFTGGAETITVSDGTTAGDNITRIDSTLGELVDFTTPTNSLTIITNGGDLTLFNAFDSSFNTPNLIVQDTTAASTFRLGAAERIPNATSLVVNNLAVFDLNAFNETIAGLSGGGAVDNSPAGVAALTVGSGNATSTFSGVIQDTGGNLTLVKTGTGTLTLSNANTYAGGTTISQGTIIGVNNTAFGTGTITLNDAATGGNNTSVLLANSVDITNPIIVSNNGAGVSTIGTSGAGVGGNATTYGGAITADKAVTFNSTVTDRTDLAGAIGGPGALTFSGGNRTTVSNTGGNTFTGGVTVTGAGTIFQVGVVTSGNFIPDTNSVDVGAGSFFYLALGAGGSESINGLTGTGTIQIHPGVANAETLAIGANNTTSTFGGTIINGGGTLAITKVGTGTLTLTNGNTYTGATTINAGTVEISGGGTISVSSAIAVNNTGTLRLSRNDTWGNHTTTTSSPITVNAGGTLATNNTFNTLVNLTLNGGTVTLNGGANADFPALALKGTVTVGGAQASVINPGTGNFNVISLGDTAAPGTTIFNVADATGNANADLIINVPLKDNRNNANLANQPATLTKSGVGTLTLNPINGSTYSGGTSITAGTILTGARGLGSGTVDVGAAGTLRTSGVAGLASLYYDIVPAGATNPNFVSQDAFLNHLGANVPFLVTNAPTMNFGTAFPDKYANGATENFEAFYSGLLNITTAGTYTFNTTSDDGSMLFVDGLVVVSNNFDQGPTTRSGSVVLSAGAHTIAIAFYERGGGQHLQAQMSGAGNVTMEDIDSSMTNGATVTSDLVISNLTGSGSVVLENGGLNIGTGNGASNFTGVISGAGIGTSVATLTKLGSGTVTLGGANTFGGKTLLHSGAVLLGNANALQNSTAHVAINNALTFSTASATYNVGGLESTGNVVLQNTSAAAITLSVGANNASTTHSGVLSGLGTLTKVGTGTLTLSGGNNTYTGGTNINAGAITTAGRGLGSGLVTVAAAGTLNVASVGGLAGLYYNTTPANVGNQNPNFNTLDILNGHIGGLGIPALVNNAPTQNFGGGGAGFPAPYNAGAVNFESYYSGILNVTTAGTYTFNTSTDDGSMLWVDGVLVVNNNFFQGVTTRTGTIVLGAGAHTIVTAFYQGGGGYGMNAQISGPGNVTMEDIDTTMANGLSITSDLVIGSLTGAGAVSLQTGGLIVGTDNTSPAAFTGAISGNVAGVTKFGNGTLTLSGANTYAGRTAIGGGMLTAGSGSALGSAAGFTTVSGSATLNVNGQNLGAELVRISGTGVGGLGALVNNGGVQTQALRFITLIADATVGGTGRFDIRTNGGGETLDLAGFTLTKVGANQFSIVGTNVTNGNMTANAGTLSVETTSTVGGTGTITINGGATLGLWNNTGTFTRDIVLAGGSRIQELGSGGPATVNSNISLTGNSTVQVDGAATNLNLGGVISSTGAFGFTKTGVGRLVLNGAGSNTYSGTTILDNGIMTLSKTGGAVAIAGPMQMGSGNANQPYLRMGANNQFGTSVIMTEVNTINNWVRFDLLGTSQTLAGIQDTVGGLVIQNGGIGAGSAVDATLTISNAGNHTLRSHIRDFDNVNGGGRLNIVKNGAGTLTMASLPGGGTRVNYTGTTNVNNGTLELIDLSQFAAGGGVNFSSSTVTITSPGILEVDSSIAFTTGGVRWNYAGTLTGNGTLNKTGTGVFGVPGTVSMSGQINIQAGRIHNDNVTSNWTASTANVDISAGAVLDLRANDIYVNQLTGTGEVWNSHTAGGGDTLFVGVAGGSSAFGGVIRGTNTGVNDTPDAASTALVKNGGGTFTLSNKNPYVGGTTVNAGVLSLTSTANNGASTVGTGDLVINAAGTVIAQTGDNQLGYGGPANIPNVFIVGGTFTASSPFGGGMHFEGITMTGGTLNGTTGLNPTDTNGSFITTLASGNTANISAPITNGKTNFVITVADGGAATDVLLSSSVNGGAATGVTKSGPGLLDQTGTWHNFAGALVVNGGTFNTGGTNLFTPNHTTGKQNTFSMTVDGATWSNTGGAVNRVGNVTLSNGATWALTTPSNDWGTYFMGPLSDGSQPTLTVGGASASTISGTGNLRMGVSPTFNVANVNGTSAVDLTVSVPLENQTLDQGFAAAGLDKAGAGTMTLSSASTYTGTTNVNAGTLNLTGTLSTGAVNVNNTGTLVGTGTAGGAATVNPGGTINPGTVGTAGTLTVGALNFNGGTYAADLIGTANDRIFTAGVVNLANPTAGIFSLNNLAAGVAPTTVFTFIDNTAVAAIANPPLTNASEGQVITVDGKNAIYSYLGAGAGNDLTLTVAGAVVTTGTAGNDQFELRRLTIGLADVAQLLLGGLVVESRPFASVDSWTINASGGDDSLFINYGASGGFFDYDVFWNGEANTTGDILSISGATVTTVTHTFLNANDGQIEVLNGTTHTIQYTGLEPITDNLNATNRVFTFTGGAETVTLSDDPTPGNNVSFINSTLGESVTFTNPTGSMTINLTNGGDTLNVEGLDSSFNANVTVTGDGGDALNFQTTDTDIDAGNLTATGIVDANFITALSTTGDVSLTLTGAATDGNGALVNITADDLAIIASTGIDLDTAINRVEAQTATGGINIADQGALVIGGISGAIGGVTVTGAGAIDISATGTISILTGGDNVTTPGSVTITATGGTSDIVAANTGTPAVGGGTTVSLAADRDVLLGDAGGTWGDVYANASMSITAGRDFTVQGQTFVDVNSSGTLTVNATRDINILLPAGAIIYSRLTTQGGVITLASGRNFTSSASDGSGNTDSIDTTQLGAAPAGAAVNITAQNISLGDRINAGSAIVTLNATAGAILDTNGAASNILGGTLLATAVTGIADGTTLETQVSNLTATNGTNDIDILNTGALTVNGATVTGAGGDIFITALSPLTIVGNVSAPGTVTLTAGENNDPGVWADDLTVNGGITVISTGADVNLRAGDEVILLGGVSPQVSAATTLSITAGFGDLDGQGGIVLGGDVQAVGDITFNAFSNIALGANVNSTGGDASLTTSNGSITRSTGTVTADDVTLSAVTGSIGALGSEVNTSANTLTTISAGNQFVIEASGLAALSLNAGTADIVLTLLAGAITDADGGVDVTANDFTVVAPGGLGAALNPIQTDVDTLTTVSVGNQFITEANGLNAIDLNAGASNIALALTAGALSDTDALLDVIANVLTVSAPAGIGALANPITSRIAQLQASANTGGIFLDNTGVMDITGATVATSGDIAINNYGADNGVTVTTVGNLTISGTVSAPLVGGNVTIIAHEIDDDLAGPPGFTNNFDVTGSVTGDNVTLRAGDDMIISSTGVVTSTSVITLHGGFNDLDMYGNVIINGTLNPGTGLVVISLGDIVFGPPVTPGTPVINAPAANVTLTSNNGSIYDNNDNQTPNSTPMAGLFVRDIVANNITLSAPNGSIGEVGDTIEITANSITATAGTTYTVSPPGVNAAVAAQRTLQIWSTSAIAVNSITDAGGPISITSDGSMTVNGPVSQTTGHDITLFAAGAASDLTLVGTVSATNTLGVLGGDITMSAGDEVFLGGGSSIVTQGSSTVTLNAGWPNQPNPLLSNPDADLILTAALNLGAANLVLTAADNVILSGPNADITAATLTVHADRDESAIGTGGSFIQDNLDSTVIVGYAQIEAADVTLLGTIDAGTGDIDIFPSNVASPIFVNNIGVGLNISLTDLLALRSNTGTISIGEPATTGTVFIGGLGTVGVGLINADYTVYGGEIDFNGGMVLADNRKLTLDSDGAITGVGPTSLDVIISGPQGTLVIDAQDDVTLYTRVTRLGAANVVGGDLTVDNSNSPMEVIVGVNAENVLLKTGPALLTVSAPVTATAAGGNITLIQDQLSLNAALTGSGILTVTGDTSATTIGLGDLASGTLSIGTAELGLITDGFSRINIGTVDQVGAVAIDSPAGNPVIFHDPTFITASLATGVVRITEGQLIGDDDASFTITGSAVTFSGAAPGIQTDGGAIFVEGAQRLDGDTTIESNGGNIELYGAINGTKDFVVNAVTGNVYINGNRTPVPSGTSVGGENALRSIDVTGAEINLRPSIHTIGAQTYTAGTGIHALGGRFTSSTPGGDITFNGALDLLSRIAVTTANQNIIFNGTVDSTAAGNGGLTLNAGTGGIQFNGAIGSIVPLKDFEVVNAGQLSIAGAFSGGDFIVQLDELDLLGGANSVVLNGRVEIRTLSTITAMEIGGAESGAADTLSLSSDDIEAFADGVESMLLIRANGQQPININGPVTFHDPTTIRQVGSLNQPINVNGDFDADTADGSIALVSTQTFLNGNISTTGGGFIDIENAILTGNVTLDSSVGGGNVTLRGTLNAVLGGEDLTILTGTGSATLSAANKLSSSSDPLPGTVTITGGDARIDRGIAMGSLVIDGGGTTYIKARIRTTGVDGQEYNDPVVLIGNSEFRSYDALGLIHVASTLDSDPTNLLREYSLTITNRTAPAGSTVVMFDAGVGQTRELNVVRVKTGGDVAFAPGASLSANALILRAGNFEVQDVTTTGTQFFFGAGTFSGAINAAKLTVVSTTDLANNAPWNVTGLATLYAKGNDIDITGGGNHFGELKFKAENVTIEEDGNMALRYAKINGTFNATTNVFGAEPGDLDQTTGRALINRIQANLSGSLNFDRDDSRIYQFGDITAGGTITLLSAGARYVLLDGTITATGDIVLAASAYGTAGSFRTGGSTASITSTTGRYVVYSYFAIDNFDGTDLTTDLLGLVDTEQGPQHPAAPASTDNVLVFVNLEH